jgi:hypothetical protein
MPRRRDPAWLWYGVAVVAVIAFVILDVTGVLGSFGP